METYTNGPFISVCRDLFREYSGMDVEFRAYYEVDHCVIRYQPPVGLYQLSCGNYYCHELISFIVTSHSYEIAYRKTNNPVFRSAMLRVRELCVMHPQGYLAVSEWL